jgi:L-asparaginase II
MAQPLRIGSWARAGEFIGLVAVVDGEHVTLFDPGDRHMARVMRSDIEPLPAGAVTVTVSVDLPVPHGVGEDTLRRWMASLIDELVRERAYSALAEAGMDEGAALPQPRVQVVALAGSGAVCLCGARMPAPPGTALTCPKCGREAVSAPRTDSDPGLLG